MALSGSIQNSYRGWTYRISWSASQSISNNRSTITCDHYLVLSSGYSISIGSRTNTCTVGGAAVNYTSAACSGSGTTIKLGTTTHTVNHNSDGTASVTISGTFNIQATLSGSYQSSITASGAVTLDTIPRKSTLTAGNGTLGTAKALTINRASSSFTHTITWACGSKSGTICTRTTNTTVYFDPSNGNTISNLAGQAPNSGSVGVVFTLTTYDASGNSLGTTQPATAYFTIPDSVAPTATIALSDAEGLLAVYGGYVQGKSRVHVVTTAELAYESPIVQCTVDFDGATITGDDITTDYIKSSGTLSVTVTLKDGRGHTGTATRNVAVLPYAVPKITNAAAYRSAEDGAANSTGAYITVSFTGDISALSNNNSASYAVSYRHTGDTSYTEATLTDYSGVFAASASYTFPAGGTSYEIIVSATDDFTTTSTAITGAALKKFLSFKWSETENKYNGIGVLKTAEHENGVDIGGDLYDKHLTIVGNGLAEYNGAGSNAIDANETKDHCILTDKNAPSSSLWYIHTMFKDDKDPDSDKAQIAIPYNENGVIYNRHKINGVWSEWTCNGTDYVIEQGTSGIWDYVKYASGLAECWTFTQIQINVTTAAGSLYYSDLIPIQLPFAMTDVTFTGSVGQLETLVNPGQPDEDHINFRVMRCTQHSYNTDIALLVKGRWKEAEA